MTPQDIIDEARFVLNDTDDTAYRNSDTELLGWVNNALDVAVGIVPDLFMASGTHTCTAGAEQTVTLARCVSINRVNRIVGGNIILPADKASMDAFRPGWMADDEAAAVNWLQHENQRKKFYLHPPAPAGQDVDVSFVQAPAALGLTDAIPLPDNSKPALVAYVVGMTESKDDEHVNSNRAEQAKAEFAVLIKGS